MGHSRSGHSTLVGYVGIRRIYQSIQRPDLDD